MELRMNFTSFIKIKDASRINDICGEILDYRVTEDGVVGSLGINGKYYKNDLEKENQFNESIPFNIVFTTPKFELIDLDCVNLDYDLVDGRGIEVSFDIKVEYNELEDAPDAIETIGERTVEEQEETVPTIESTELEEIKDEITEKVSSKLEETLKFKDDNLPTETENFLDNLEEKRSKIKVCYYSNDKELENVCAKNDISLDKVFKDNKNNDISKYQRVIIK
ncbi:MAG: hypothetical protein MR485_00990 [Mollicutes bacterium]|nr:hypothetical protein [Mollicutes bacterium]